ncbi:MAG TPA: AbrB/MazE/SpoVT family DNA-binding domain-containing protein [Caulobacteraceae bacterium]|nr:AbrB/MazE/SpoVT family DNA-binding domain-containing protein [Caulobacteraceae bacterium]
MSLTSDRMAAIAAPYATVSDRIRALAAAGAPRADIARFLGKRYQHVRNVLEADAQRGYTLGRVELGGGLKEESSHFGREDEDALVERRGSGGFWLTVRPDGSVYLPREVAEALGGSPGRRVFANLADGELTVISAERAMEQARALVRKHIPAGGDLVESFLAERPGMWSRDRQHGR